MRNIFFITGDKSKISLALQRKLKVSEPWGRFERPRSVAKGRRKDDGTVPVA